MSQFDSLKVGDKVCTRYGFHPTKYYIGKVTKITRTQIICGMFDRFYKASGKQIGSDSTYLTLDPEHFEIAQQQAAEKTVRKERYGKLRLEHEAREKVAQDALNRVRHYLRMRADESINQLGDGIHTVHTGTAWEAELRLSDLQLLLGKPPEKSAKSDT